VSLPVRKVQEFPNAALYHKKEKTSKSGEKTMGGEGNAESPKNVEKGGG